MHVELFGQPIICPSLKDSALGTEVLFRMGGADLEDQVSPLEYLNSMNGFLMPLFMDATVIGILLAGDTTAVTGNIFLNVCPETLTSQPAFESWLAGVRELCRRHPADVVIEIPEQCGMEFGELVRRLNSIASAGARLALDDYPGGSLTEDHLSSYPWDYVKVCREACRQKGISLELAIKAVKRLRPHATIIGERFTRKETAWTSLRFGVSGFQSFELGRPAPLQLRPYRYRRNLEVHESAVSINHLVSQVRK